MVEGKIHPVRIVLNRFGALQDADEAHGHRYWIQPELRHVDGLLQRIGEGVLVQQETRGNSSSSMRTLEWRYMSSHTSNVTCSMQSAASSTSRVLGNLCRTGQFPGD